MLLMLAINSAFVVCFIVILPIRAWKIHWLWSVSMVIFPFVSIIFAFLHWPVAKKTFLWGIFLMFVSIALMCLRLMLRLEMQSQG